MQNLAREPEPTILEKRGKSIIEGARSRVRTDAPEHLHAQGEHCLEVGAEDQALMRAAAARLDGEMELGLGVPTHTR